MAINRPKNLMIGGTGQTGLFLTGCGALFIAQKTLTGIALWEQLGHVIALGLIGLSVAFRVMALIRQESSLQPIERKLMLFHTLAAFAVVLYGLQTDWARQALGMLIPPAGTRDTYGVVLGVAWPVLWLAGSLPMALLEIVAGPMRRSGALESRRITAAWRSGVTGALAISFLFVGNYVAFKHNKQFDLAYFQTTRPGTATMNLVKRLEEPVEVILFFPRANDVLERAKSYTDVLAPLSEKLQVKAVDRLLDPVLARRHRVRKNGVIIIAHGNKREKIKLGTELKKARRKLSKLDREFLTRLTKVVAQQRVAYLLTGHGEVNEALNEDGSSQRARDKMVREVLAFQGYKVKNLGVADGLAAQVPDDAAVVIALGPQTPLLPGEATALSRYVTQNNGRLLLALDPEKPIGADKLLTTLGLRLQDGIMTHDRFHLRQSYNSSDRQLVATSSFSSHPSVKTLSRASRKTALAFNQCGHLERTENKDKSISRKIDFTVRSMPETWADVNGNKQFDSASETKKVFQLAAAITLGDAKDSEKTGRAVVVADSDMFDDSLMRYRGNLLFLSDSLRFLAGQEDLAGTVESEEDKPLEHTESDDVVWFYGTVFAIPMSILLLGMGYLRRIRRSR